MQEQIMKKLISAIILGAFICSGCINTAKIYRTTTTISQEKQAHQYMVEFKIKEIKGEKENIIAVPKIMVKAGKEGKIEVRNDKLNNELFCTVLITEFEKGIEANTEVIIWTKGEELFNNTQTIIMNK